MNPDADTEFNDVLRAKGILPPKPPSRPPSPELPAISHADALRAVASSADAAQLDLLLEADGLDSDDERMFASYRRQRMAEMRAEERRGRFGSMDPLAREDFVRLVTEGSKEGPDGVVRNEDEEEENSEEETSDRVRARRLKGTGVVVFLYKDSVPLSQHLSPLLHQLAAAHPATRFLSIPAQLCIPNYPDKNVPTLLVYRAGDVRGNIVAGAGLSGLRTNVRELEALLIRYTALEAPSSALRPVRNDSDDDDDAAGDGGDVGTVNARGGGPSPASSPSDISPAPHRPLDDPALRLRPLAMHPPAAVHLALAFSSRAPPHSHAPYMTPPIFPHLLRLPDELLVPILSHSPLPHLLSLRLVCRRLASLALAPSLHRTLYFTSIPSPLPPLLAQLAKHGRHLTLHPFPYPSARAVLALFDELGAGQLQSLSMPFAPPHVVAALGPALARIGTRLTHLDLRGSDLSFLDSDWLAPLGAAGPGLHHLDLGYTSLVSLPLEPLRHLTRLSLSFAFISRAALAKLLADLPPSIERLDLSRLPHLPLAALMGVPVTTSAGPTRLKEVNVIGIDHLTRTDIRRLQRHWDDQRRSLHVDEPLFVPVAPRSPRTPEHRSAALFEPPLTPPDDDPSSSIDSGSCAGKADGRARRHRCPTPDEGGIRIVHSAILESEDEAGYRQFIGEVVGASVEWPRR
ncbi:Proteolipid protein 2 [Cryptotrichosporon argae]